MAIVLNAVLTRLEKSEIKTLASFSLAEAAAQMPIAVILAAACTSK